jgi:flavin-dependent dehydrogenase
MQIHPPRPHWDCVVVGASFAGLATATAMARAGLRVVVLEKKADVGEKLHTTGIIVKDAIDEIALLEGLPIELVHRISGVRLYAPNLRHVDLSAPGYYFLATDTPGVMRWLAAKTERAGARVVCRTPFVHARRMYGGFDLGEVGTTSYLVGADGPNSRVAHALGLGRNSQFLFGIEHEYAGAKIADPHRMHCFIDRGIAPGYIAWVVSGVGLVQVGLARRVRDGQSTARAAMAAFLDKIAPLFDFRDMRPASIRAGRIPCGGVVSPEAAERTLLVGDAAGMVSPLTAGGIHTALKHGTAAGRAIAEYVWGRKPDPSAWFVGSYPRFRVKRLLRYAFDRFQSDTLFNLLLGTRPMRAAASIVYFHRRGVFDPTDRNVRGMQEEGISRDSASRLPRVDN